MAGTVRPDRRIIMMRLLEAGDRRRQVILPIWLARTNWAAECVFAAAYGARVIPPFLLALRRFALGGTDRHDCRARLRVLRRLDDERKSCGSVIFSWPSPLSFWQSVPRRTWGQGGLVNIHPCSRDRSVDLPMPNCARQTMSLVKKELWGTARAMGGQYISIFSSAPSCPNFHSPLTDCHCFVFNVGGCDSCFAKGGAVVSGPRPSTLVPTCGRDVGREPLDHLLSTRWLVSNFSGLCHRADGVGVQHHWRDWLRDSSITPQGKRLIHHDFCCRASGLGAAPLRFVKGSVVSRGSVGVKVPFLLPSIHHGFSLSRPARF